MTTNEPAAVFVVFGVLLYEHSDVISVHASKSGAEVVVADAEKAKRASPYKGLGTYDYFEIESHEVRP